MWWVGLSPLAKVSTVTGGIIGITGSIVGLSHAAPIIKDYWYVAQYELQLVQNSQSIATDRQTLFQLQQYLANALKDPKASGSATAQEYISDLKKKIDETQKRVDRAASSK